MGTEIELKFKLTPGEMRQSNQRSYRMRFRNSLFLKSFVILVTFGACTGSILFVGLLLLWQIDVWQILFGIGLSGLFLGILLEYF